MNGLTVQPTRSAMGLMRWSASGSAPVVLVCLPYAGGGREAYRGWSSALTDVADIAVVDLATVDETGPGWGGGGFITRLADDIAATFGDEREVALIGCSYGALLGYEAALELTERGRSPRHLFVLAHAAPRRLVHAPTPLHQLSDDELVAFLGGLDRRGGGLRASFLRLALPALRRDLGHWESYGSPRRSRLLTCPITAVSGAEDALVPARLVGCWGEETAGSFRHRTIGGAHFFVTSHRGQVQVLVREALLERQSPEAA